MEFTLDNFKALYQQAEAASENRKAFKAEQEKFKRLLEIRERQVSSLFEAIKHGSDEHQAWLKEKIGGHFGIKL